MAKQVKVVQAPYNWDARFGPVPGIQVRAYLTATAGLAVCHTHKLKKNTILKTQEVLPGRTWSIITYPSGHTVVLGFKTKAEAIAVAEGALSKFSWVCMFKEEFEHNNDMSEVRRTLMRVSKVILA